MTSISSLLEQVAQIDADIGILMRDADRNDIAIVDQLRALLDRAEALLIRAFDLAALGGEPAQALEFIRHAALACVDAQIAASDHRTKLVTQQAIADAKRSTMH